MFSKAPTVALIDSVIPVDDRVLRAARDVALIVGASLFVALMAQLVIRLPFTPVPITGQTLAVLLTGAALGSWRGGAALLLYLVEGSFLPFYAGGASGLVWALGSGGYIIGFIPAAFVVGFLSERGWDRSVWIILSMLAGNIILYIPGLIQLSYFVPEGKVLEYGLYPFILGDLVKLYIASLALPTAWAVVNRFQPPSAQ